MKGSDFVGMAKMHLPYLAVKDSYDQYTYQINDNWKQQVIYWGFDDNKNLKPSIEVWLTYDEAGFSKKSNKKQWCVLAEKFNDEDDWVIRTPFRCW